MSKADSLTLAGCAAPRNVFFSILLMLSLCSCDKKAPPPAPPPPNVVCVAAVKEDVAHSYEYIGQTVAEESVSIVPMVEGYLTKQCFDEGSMVKKGDLLFEIDPRTFEAQVKNAEGQLASAKAKLVNANTEYVRYTTLLKQTATSQKDQDIATMNKGQAEGDLLVSQASLDSARINLDYTKLFAPFDGKIGVCPTSVGNLVGQASNRQPLTSIMRLDPMKVEFNIPELTAASIVDRHGNLDDIKNGVIVRIRLPNGTPYPQEGAIYFIDNQVTAATGTIKVRARFPNPKSVLTPNEYVKVELVSRVKQPAMLISKTALAEDMTGSFVMVVKNGVAERRQVKTGQGHGQNIEVLSGVEEGEWVVTEGLLKVRHGTPANAKLKSADKERAQ